MSKLWTPGLISSPQRLIDGKLPPTLGPHVVRWMETALVYGPGDLAGQPYRVDPFLKPIIYRLYEYDPHTGDRLTRRALVGVPKGNSKSEMAAAVALVELAGPSVVVDGKPSMRTDPDIPVGAASYEQADLVYGAARTMAGGPIKDFLDIYETEMLLKDRPGRLYRVAAVAGTNDGRRPTMFIADEVHEWTGNKERVHLVLSNGLFKRTDSTELNITTAGSALESLAGRLYSYGLRHAKGEVDNDSFVFFWWQGPEDVNLDDPEALRAALRVANPASWVDVDALAGRYEIDGMPPWEFQRYHLNQWTAAAERWLPLGSWQALSHPEGLGAPPAGSDIVVAFDGSYSRDSTAVIGWTMLEGKPHGWVIGVWERPEGVTSWVVPREQVESVVVKTFSQYRVQSFVMDRAKWYDEYARWAERFGEPPVMDYPQTHKRMANACATTYAAVVQGDLTHDGNPLWARHLENAVVKETADGAHIVKDGRNSPRKIDLAVAGVMGLQELLQVNANNKPVEVTLSLV
jgi:phage terminase large subunit-like protein